MLDIKIRQDCVNDVIKLLKTSKIRHGPITRNSKDPFYKVPIYDERCLLLLILKFPDSIINDI